MSFGDGGKGAAVKTPPEKPAAAADANDLARRELYVNREMSLLDFQRRVLEEAQDPGNPLLERVKFLSIVGSNLDEFFMVRVAGLKQQLAAGVVDGVEDQTAAEQLAAIRRQTLRLMEETRSCWRRDLAPRLAEHDVHVLDYAGLSAKQRENVDAFFDEMIFPVLTPLAFDPGRPFPHISNLSLNLAVAIRDPQGNDRFARVKVPGTLPRLLPVKRSSGGTKQDGTAPKKHYFVWLEQVIAARLDKLFPGMTVVESYPFHVTRDADVLIQELEAEDLLESIEEGVRRRRFGAVTRLKIDPSTPPHIREILVENLEVDPRDVYALAAPLGLASLMQLAGAVDRPDLKDRPFRPAIAPGLEREEAEDDIFVALRRGDVLLHHPYDSFTPVVDFLRASARDADVLAIKQTLYRVGRNSPVVKALLDARENGKQVAVLVELKARFDEESNINWARALEAEGTHVVYGLLGLKTHSKIAMVVRREGKKLRRYVHLSTGNYNAVTAQLYTDIGYFTCDEEIGDDATHLFNYLTGYSAKQDFKKLLVAPINLRARLTDLIRREAEHAQAGRGGHLVLKVNALIDRPMIQELYRASSAGVKIELIVRGMCCLRPGVPGVSENITVRSIVGRFLEHSRIFWFANGGAEEVYLGSADLMPRNLNRRVEVMFPVAHPAHVRYLRDAVLAAYLADNVKARVLQPDGSWTHLAPGPKQERFAAQERLMAARGRK